MKVLLSGDIETNPGPIENVVSNSISHHYHMLPVLGKISLKFLLIH